MIKSMTHFIEGNMKHDTSINFLVTHFKFVQSGKLDHIKIRSSSMVVTVFVITSLKSR